MTAPRPASSRQPGDPFFSRPPLGSFERLALEAYSAVLRAGGAHQDVAQVEIANRDYKASLDAGRLVGRLAAAACAGSPLAAAAELYVRRSNPPPAPPSVDDLQALRKQQSRPAPASRAAPRPALAPLPAPRVSLVAIWRARRANRQSFIND